MTWHPDIPHEYRSAIITGDARVLAERIPDESIDLIFTDPVYDQIDDYRWLAETAARVLKPDRACLVWIANPRLLSVAAVMSRLNYVMPLNYVRPGNTYMIFSRKVFMWSTQCLWLEKGLSKVNTAIPDAIVSYASTNGRHKWNKNPEAFVNWTKAFTDTTSIILDPFTGGGTVPAVCKMLNRNYIAFEIDPDTAELARERVRNTQPPLPLKYHEQLELLPGD